MSAAIDTQLTELLERVKGVRYFYALGHGGSSHPNPILERIAELHTRRDLLVEELKEGTWTAMTQLNLERVARDVFEVEQDVVTEQSSVLGERLSFYTPQNQETNLGLSSEIGHASELLAHSRVPATDSIQTRNRLACLGHADQLIRSINACLRLNRPPTCDEFKVRGVRQTDGAGLYFVQLRLENLRARLDVTADEYKNTLDKIDGWQTKLDSAWSMSKPGETEIKYWTNTLRTIDHLENKFHTLDLTRIAYERERTHVIASADAIVADGEREHPAYEVSNDLREEIRQLACRFLRPVDSARLNPNDCAVWTKLVTTLNKINNTQPRAQHMLVSSQTSISVHEPTARVPGVGVAVIDRLRRRPWEL